MCISTLRPPPSPAGHSWALALPSIGPLFSREKTCLTRAEAKEIVDIYARLIGNYKPEDCKKYCAERLRRPLYNPPFPVVIDSIDAVDCEAIGLRWHATFGAANKPSRDITIIGTTKTAGWWQIQSLDVEFNSLVWLPNMGGNYTWEG
ncbi:hypothetical protein VTI74DRAFT_5469 [Chaetomium olivicolor]